MANNRLDLITRRGGSQAKELLVRYTADRERLTLDYRGLDLRLTEVVPARVLT